MSRREVFVPPVTLDSSSQIPLRRQIYLQIARAIRNGSIPGETRLPSTRLMARLAGVSRNTVLAAYDDLAADGLVRGERGSGMRVHGRRAVMLSGLQQLIRAAGYPARVVDLADPDGNSLSIRF